MEFNEISLDNLLRNKNVNRIRNLALIGAGYWGKKLARNFHELGALHTIYDTCNKTCKLVSSQYKSVKETDLLDNILKDDLITSVAIAAPAKDHYQLAKKSLIANKDVFVEKPIALSLKEADELVNLAKDKKRVLMVGHLLHYHPCVNRVKELVTRGAIGKIFYISSNRLNFGKIREEENALWSFAPHDFSVIISLANNKLPEKVQCVGGAYLNKGIADTTMTTMKFHNGIRAHVYVSWLNPFKEQKLTVVGSNGMIVFDDTKNWNEKLTYSAQPYKWVNGKISVAGKISTREYLPVFEAEPLRIECAHFLECCDKRSSPLTDGVEGQRVLKVLSLAQNSLQKDGVAVELNSGDNQIKKYSIVPSKQTSKFKIDPTSVIDKNAIIGNGTKVWHFTHICSNVVIGENCTIGQNTFIADGVIIGSNVKVQNNVSIYTGLTIEDDVFLGPSCVLTNVTNPRSQISRNKIYEKTLIRKGATVGANATIVPGVTLGYYCFIAAGAVVTNDVKDYALMKGNPAKRAGWMGRLTPSAP